MVRNSDDSTALLPVQVLIALPDEWREMLCPVLESECDKGKADGLRESVRGRVPTITLISASTWQGAHDRWFDYRDHPPLHEYCSIPVSTEELLSHLEKILKAAA